MAEAPLSLYFDLEEGQVADLEVVARSALAFAAAVQEVAYIIDPGLDIRIELESGSPGSLSLNAILRNLRDHKGETITLGAVALIILSWLGNHALDYGFEKLMDGLTGKDAQEHHFTPEQRKELGEIVTGAIDKRLGESQVQRFYGEVERDPAIRGVGGTTDKGARPAIIVPRAEFPARAGRAEPREVTISRRERLEKVRVLLISPVLLPGNRRWKLRSAQSEFGAAIKDQEFINRVLSGTTPVRMKAGIEMDIDLQTVEEFRHGVWEVVERSVTHVNRLIEPPSQADLGLFQSDDTQSDDDDN
jgi:hypothetical protein